MQQQLQDSVRLCSTLLQVLVCVLLAALNPPNLITEITLF